MPWEFKDSPNRLFLILREMQAEQAGSIQLHRPHSSAVTSPPPPPPPPLPSMLQKCQVPYYQGPRNAEPSNVISHSMQDWFPPIEFSAAFLLHPSSPGPFRPVA